MVQYRDTDGNGFFDVVEYDYEGDRKVDLKVALLDYASAANPHPDVVPLIDTHAAGWSGLHDAFTTMANDGWREALDVYRAAWRRGLTDPELDRLANAASVADRYESGYWLKEKVFRTLRARLADAARGEPKRAAAFRTLEKRLIRSYYTARFDEYVKAIAEVPGR